MDSQTISSLIIGSSPAVTTVLGVSTESLIGEKYRKVIATKHTTLHQRTVVAEYPVAVPDSIKKEN